MLSQTCDLTKGAVVPPSALPTAPTAFVSSRTVPYVVRVGGEYFRGLVAVDGFVSVGPVVAIESPSKKFFPLTSIGMLMSLEQQQAGLIHFP